MSGFVTDDFCFVHFPKTAGMWFHSTAAAAGVAIRAVTPADQNHIKLCDDKPTIAFIRSPAEWYKSLYLYHRMHDWHFRPDLSGSTFVDFFRWQIETETMSAMWDRIVGEADHVGSCLWLYQDAARFIQMMGGNATVEDVRSRPRENASNFIACKFPGDYWETICRVDRKMIDLCRLASDRN